tara:strand:- start:339 stop:587 length:249 start_codon:yes stop_codon:yes gene_type:complete
MPSNVLSTLFKILLASLILGFLLKFFEIDPKDLLLNFGQTLRNMFAWAGDFVAGSVEYVLIGAIIVVPVWLIVFFAGKLRGK